MIGLMKQLSPFVFEIKVLPGRTTPMGYALRYDITSAMMRVFMAMAKGKPPLYEKAKKQVGRESIDSKPRDVGSAGHEIS